LEDVDALTAALEALHKGQAATDPSRMAEQAATDPSRVAENEPIPDSDVTFGEINLRPSTRKSIKALTKFSNEMARHSEVGPERR
jgi:hypothetical protein